MIRFCDEMWAPLFFISLTFTFCYTAGTTGKHCDKTCFI